MTSFLWGMVAGALGMLLLQAFDRAREKNNLDDPVEDGKLSQLRNQNDAQRARIDTLERFIGQLQFHLNYCEKHHRGNPSNVKWVEGE